jgi:hypothetical protein
MAREKKRYAEELKLAAIADNEYQLRGLTSEKDGAFVMSKVAEAYPNVQWVLYQYRPVSTAVIAKNKKTKTFKILFKKG